ncbi:MAG TPA: YbaL family putative K(+) efflux transporter [Gemmatimonadales bacterium]|nr:YbaL family putative K(+) efflux transporter [Gemmatimonadales bacterium]
MPHDTALIAIIAGGLVLSFLFGVGAARLGLPPLVGYLLAGVAIGPHTQGFVADTALAQQLAEIGVILLMFGVGIHFSAADLLAVRRIAVTGASVQIVLATALGAAVAHWWGWPLGSGLVFGICLSVASTVVLLRALEDRGLLGSFDGRIAVGWLVVEDLVTVLVLVLLPALAVPLGGTARTAPDGGLAATMALTLAKVGGFVAVMFVVGRRVVPWLLERVARMASRELFTLAVLAVALGIAVGASVLFGVSFALGAFFAGMVVNGSDLSHEAAADSLPLQDAFSVLFFVAVGMLFDPAIVLRQPLEVLAVVLIVMVGKSLGAFGIMLASRHTVRAALTISASLAQVGEFSFILASLGVSLGLLPREGQSLIVAGAIFSIALNPLAFAATARLARWVGDRPRLSAALERPRPAFDVPPPPATSGLHGHVIVVGYGRVGGTIGETLTEAGVPFVAVEQDRVTFERLRARGVPVLYGNAGRASVLQPAHPERARLIVVTAPDPFQARAIVEIARQANPGIVAVVRTHTDEEQAYLEAKAVGIVVMGERELARAMARHALELWQASGAAAVPGDPDRAPAGARLRRESGGRLA